MSPIEHTSVGTSARGAEGWGMIAGAAGRALAAVAAAVDGTGNGTRPEPTQTAQTETQQSSRSTGRTGEDTASLHKLK